MTVSLFQLAVALAIVGCADSFVPTVGKFFRPHSTVMVVTKDIQMPALSSTMTEGKVVAWSKKIGDKVSAGDVLLVVESDKADMDVEAGTGTGMMALGGALPTLEISETFSTNTATVAPTAALAPSAV